MMPVRHLTFFPPSPPRLSETGPMGSCIQLQQRNCSRFSRDFLRRSTFSSSQITETRTSGLRLEGQDYLIICQAPGVLLGGPCSKHLNDNNYDCIQASIHHHWR